MTPYTYWRTLSFSQIVCSFARTPPPSIGAFCTLTHKQPNKKRGRPSKNRSPSPPLSSIGSFDSSSRNYFPYGAPDFGKIRDKQQFLVDKTQYVPLLEAAGEHLLFLRPPRWGKSQFLSTLQCYYDIAMQDKFTKLFGDLSIGKNPTSLRNSFHVLPLDFSIDVDGGANDFRRRLHTRINDKLRGFQATYNLNFDINEEDAFSTLTRMSEVLRSKSGGERLLVLIDEYDRFANKLMLENPDAYANIVAGISGDPASSPIRSFYETLKTIHGLRDYRTISMGLTPISLVDASGANFLRNISHDESFGDMVGFTQSDLRRALADINITDARADILLNVMTRFYNGYRFFGSSEPLYNSTLCLYFLMQLSKPDKFDRILEYAAIPSPTPMKTKSFTKMIMVDSNVQISENVMYLISRSPIDVQLIISKLLNPATAIETITSFPMTFKIREMLVPVRDDQTHQEVRERLFSYMFHQGLVTLDHTNFPLGEIPLRVPNEMVRGPLMDSLQAFLRLSQKLVITTIESPTVERVKQLVWSIVEKQQTLHDNSFSEGALQGEVESALRALALSSAIQFSVHAELVLQAKNQRGGKKERRSDLVLICGNYALILEFKRVRPNALVGENFDVHWFSSDYLQFREKWLKKSEEELECSRITPKLAYMYHNCTEVGQLEEIAKEQALDYQRLMQAKHPNLIQIRAFTVVQVGWPLLVKQVN